MAHFMSNLIGRFLRDTSLHSSPSDIKMKSLIYDFSTYYLTYVPGTQQGEHFPLAVELGIVLALPQTNSFTMSFTTACSQLDLSTVLDTKVLNTEIYTKKKFFDLAQNVPNSRSFNYCDLENKFESLRGVKVYNILLNGRVVLKVGTQ